MEFTDKQRTDIITEYKRIHTGITGLDAEETRLEISQVLDVIENLQPMVPKHRNRQRKALRKVWSEHFALTVDDVFLDLIIDTVEGA